VIAAPLLAGADQEKVSIVDEPVPAVKVIAPTALGTVADILIAAIPFRSGGIMRSNRQ
jgi:hypothetical protein